MTGEERQLLNLLFPPAGATTTTVNPLSIIGGAIGGLLGITTTTTTTTPAPTTAPAKFNPLTSIIQLIQGLISAGVITTPNPINAALGLAGATNPVNLLTQALQLLG